ncbi:MAG: IS1182 family transposase, partial [Myxococcota bacterium]
MNKSYIQGQSRDAPMLLPPRLDELIDPDSVARLIDVFVDHLDLEPLGIRAVRDECTRGRPAFHPTTMLKLYIYGYLHRTRSSRLLQREARVNLEMIWLLQELRPDFHTIAAFRARNEKAFTSAFSQFNAWLKQLGAFGGELAALDGVKLRASNSTDKVFTKARLAKLITETSGQLEEITQWMLQLDDSDDEDDEAEAEADDQDSDHSKGSRRRKRQAGRARMARARDRLAGCKRRLRELERSEDSQIALSDPDCRLMYGNHPRTTEASYNGQIAVDDQHGLIAAQDVTNEANDRRQLAPMTEQLVENLGVDAEHPLVLLADSGYDSAEQFLSCEQHEGVTTLVPLVKPSAPKDGAKLFTKAQFEYDAQRDEYRCPAGETLPLGSETRSGQRPDRRYYYHRAACRACALRAQCTRAKEGVRKIRRRVSEAARDAMAVRLSDPENRARLRKRGGLVEAPFGTLKRQFGYGYFLVRGIEKVKGE